MNIIDIYCAEKEENKQFLDKGVNILLKQDKSISVQALKEKEEYLKVSLATDFLKHDPDWICKECGAPVICDYITSYYEHYTCVGKEEHSYTIR